MDDHVLWCKECGCQLPDLTARFEEQEQHLRDLEMELRRQRAQKSKLIRERNLDRKMDPMREKAEEVFEYWKVTCAPHAREFTGDRFDAVCARLRAGHEVETLMRAVDGARARPRKGMTTDLKTVCRNEENLMMFLDFAENAAAPKRRDDPTLAPLYSRMITAFTPRIARRVSELRGWTYEAMGRVGTGYDPASRRLVFPARDAAGSLVGLSRYQPNPDRRGGKPKNIACGSRELFPRPEDYETPTLWLVEGEPDAVAMISLGYPAVAVPGVGTWKKDWAQRFGVFERVRVLFDSDEAGREAAHARSAALSQVTEVTVLDLDPDRDDGYDVGDLLMEVGEEGAARTITQLGRNSGASSVLHMSQPKASGGISLQQSLPEAPSDGLSPIERIGRALEYRDCRMSSPGPGRLEAQCPAHDDRHASLSVTEGDDGRVLLHCHTGCSPDEVVKALGLEWKELFAAA